MKLPGKYRRRVSGERRVFKLGGFMQCEEFLDELRNCQLRNTLLVRFVCELLTVDRMKQIFP